jgi:7,8-dihydropterin-6-yl-methyl-4-(beta-D-ribofuranosyl)aminobenzene 5'-phosphate synthase
MKNSSITILVDETAREGLGCEHGLSLWVKYRGVEIFFDTGQSDLVINNARRLGIDPAGAQAVVLSHGHYDHTGGLPAVLDVVRQAAVYAHPAAIEAKFSRRDDKTAAIGIPDSARELIARMDNSGKVVWTKMPTEIAEGLFVTGEIPRITNFEEISGGFFVDRDCREADTFVDDQALFFDSESGLIVLLGCAHRGVANTLHYVAKLSGKEGIYAVIGGMHLSGTSAERIEHTITVFRQYNVQKIVPAHCTGDNAVEEFEKAFSDRCLRCSAGMRIDL